MKHLSHFICALLLTFFHYDFSSSHPHDAVKTQLRQSIFDVDNSGSSNAIDVDLGYAIYRGSFNATENRTDFLGVRYAAPPTGSVRDYDNIYYPTEVLYRQGTLRFQAPMPPKNTRSEGILSANALPPSCLQSGFGTKPISPFLNLSTELEFPMGSAKVPMFEGQSEDCLFLNVFVSGRAKETEKMPVIVWIHGGGYVLGSSAMHPAENFIQEADGGLVVVVVQYRLGLFGFLPGTEVKEKGALNAGLLDQRRALVWVQDYIHLFGGDPERVTIWGESAGAGSVVQHMIAHGGNSPSKLFTNVITSSIYLPQQYKYNDPIPEKIYRESVRLSGCGDETDKFRCLVESDTETLQNANLAINDAGFFGTFVFTPVVDAEYIVEHPLRTSLRRQFNGKKLLAVSNTFEGRMFVNTDLADRAGIKNYARQYFPQLKEEEIEEIVEQYSGIGLDTAGDQAIALVGESTFICPTYTVLSTFPGESYKGLFAVPPGNHAGDLQYYMPDINLPIPIDDLYENVEFKASFGSGFFGLAKFDDLNDLPFENVISPKWDAFSNRKYSEMLFNRTDDYTPDIRAIRSDPGLLHRCQFWEEKNIL